MGKPLNKRLVAAYADAFKQFPVLRERGFSILLDSSSKLFKKNRPSLKDVEANTEAQGLCRIN